MSGLKASDGARSTTVKLCTAPVGAASVHASSPPPHLAQIERALGNAKARKRHLELFERYRPDDNAQDRAVRIYRGSHPAADRAAQTIVIYDLR